MRIATTIYRNAFFIPLFKTFDYHEIDLKTLRNIPGIFPYYCWTVFLVDVQVRNNQTNA